MIIVEIAVIGTFQSQKPSQDALSTDWSIVSVQIPGKD